MMRATFSDIIGFLPSHLRTERRPAMVARLPMDLVMRGKKTAAQP